MENYKPYITLADTDTLLHLKMPKLLWYIHFFLLRIMGLIYLIALIFLTTNSDIPLPYLAITWVTTSILVIVLSNIPIITEVEITPLAILIRSNKFFTNKEQSIAIGDIEKIRCKKKLAKHRVFIYSVVLKQDAKRFIFLRFPRIYMRDPKRQWVNDRLQSITKLEVENI